nr:Arm DNA-binding domain-containing protein [Enterococcus faecalis]
MSFLLFACPSGKDKKWQLLNNIQKRKKYWKVTAYLGVDYLTGKQINVTIRNCNTKKEAQLKLNQKN